MTLFESTRWKPAKDVDSLTEYNLHCEEKEETAEKEVVKISESVQPFDTEKKVQPFDTEKSVHPEEKQVQPFDTEKLAEERVLVERSAEEEEEEVVENGEDGGKDNLGLED